MTNSLLIITILISSITFNSNIKIESEISGPAAKDLNENYQQVYLELRRNAINIDPAKLGLETIDKNEVYGIITEMGTRFGSVTIVSYLSGDAKIFYSSDKNLNGEISEDKKYTAQEIFKEIQQLKSKGEKIENVQLPDSDQTTFNFLTGNGIYQIKDKTENLMMGNSDNIKLYSKIESISALINK